MAQELKKAIGLGFHNGSRVRPGETFWADAEFKGKWFVAAGSDEDKAAAAIEEGDLLDKPIKDILVVLKDQSDAELRALLAAEQSGKTRKGLLAAIDDELANRLANPPSGEGGEGGGTEGGEDDNPLA